MVNEWQHNPQTCPLCADMFNPATTLVSHDDCIKHLLAKVGELEGRLQQVEWQNMPIGPGCRPHRETPEEKENLNKLLEHVQKMKSHFRNAEGTEGKEFAFRQHVVTDQGNGGAYCGSCSANLDNEYDICPGCKLPLVEGGINGSMGGSDF